MKRDTRSLHYSSRDWGLIRVNGYYPNHGESHGISRLRSDGTWFQFGAFRVSQGLPGKPGCRGLRV